MPIQDTLKFASILADSRDIEIPTIEQVLRITPHIPEDTVRAEFERVRTAPVSEYPCWYFAVPGVHVKGSYYKFCLRMVPYGDSGIWALVLSRGSCGNTLIRDGLSPTSFSNEAHEWQKAHFGYDNMINPLDADGRPRWCWFQDNYLQDPGTHRFRTPGPGFGYEPETGYDPKRGYPVTVATFAYVFEFGHDPNSTQDHNTYDRVEHHCDMMIHGLQPLLWHEVKGATRSSGATKFHCSRCGSALGLTGCGHCQLYFKDDQFRTGGGAPLGPKAQELLEKHGHTFTKDTAAVREAHSTYHRQQKEEWARRMAERTL